jgi:hypothetical protein
MKKKNKKPRISCYCPVTGMPFSLLPTDLLHEPRVEGPPPARSVKILHHLPASGLLVMYIGRADRAWLEGEIMILPTVLYVAEKLPQKCKCLGWIFPQCHATIFIEFFPTSRTVL